MATINDFSHFKRGATFLWLQTAAIPYTTYANTNWFRAGVTSGLKIKIGNTWVEFTTDQFGLAALQSADQIAEISCELFCTAPTILPMALGNIDTAGAAETISGGATKVTYGEPRQAVQFRAFLAHMAPTWAAGMGTTEPVDVLLGLYRAQQSGDVELTCDAKGSGKAALTLKAMPAGDANHGGRRHWLAISTDVLPYPTVDLNPATATLEATTSAKFTSGTFVV